MKKIILYVISTILAINLSMAQTESKTNNTGNMLPNNTKITDSRDTLKPESSFSLGDKATKTGDTYWTLSPIKDLYYNGGKVGIGTSSPVTKLEVAGTIKMTGFILPGGNTGDVLTYGSLGTAYWAAPGSGSHVQNYWTAVGDHIHFTSVTGDIGNSGNVGIGPASSNPLAKLHVFGDLRIEGPLRGGETAGAIKVQTDYGYTIIGAKAADGSYFETDKNKFIFNKDIQLAKNLVFDYNYTNSQINFGSAYNARKLKIVSQYDNGTGKGAIRGILIDENGHMGVGTDIPAEALDVAGTTKTMALNVVEDASIGGSISVGQSLTVNGISNTLRMVVTDRMNTPMFQLNSNGTTAGYVLTDADGNGNAQWTDLYSLNGVGAWTEDANGNVFIENGHVTIGGNISSPSAPLMVKSSNGNTITIGNDDANSTSYPFNIYSTNAEGNMADFVFYNPYYRSKYSWKTGSGVDNQTKMALYLDDNGQSYLQVYGNIISEKSVSNEFQLSANDDVNGFILQADAEGNASWVQQWKKEATGTLSVQNKVAIGTDHAGVHALAVNGSINAKEILVTETVPGSDYVFENDYSLMPLHQLESFVKENKHLPEVMSAEEFKKDGYSLGKMDDVLLRKVEELTLYIIQQQKEINSLKEKLSKLEN